MSKLFIITTTLYIICLSLELFVSEFEKPTNNLAKFPHCLDEIEMRVLQTKAVFMSQIIIILSIIFSIVIELLEIDYDNYSLMGYFTSIAVFILLLKYRKAKEIKLKQSIFKKEKVINKNSDKVRKIENFIKNKGSLNRQDCQRFVESMSRTEAIDCFVTLFCFKYRSGLKSFNLSLVFLADFLYNKVFDNAIANIF